MWIQYTDVIPYTVRTCDILLLTDLRNDSVRTLWSKTQYTDVHDTQSGCWQHTDVWLQYTDVDPMQYTDLPYLTPYGLAKLLSTDVNVQITIYGCECYSIRMLTIYGRPVTTYGCWHHTIYGLAVFYSLRIWEITLYGRYFVIRTDVKHVRTDQSQVRILARPYIVMDLVMNGVMPKYGDSFCGLYHFVIRISTSIKRVKNIWKP